MSFKFVHAADLHLDSPLKSLEQKIDAPVDLLRPATRRAFVNLVDLCIAEGAAFLLLAGDLYDSDCPNMQIAVFLRAQLLRLVERKIRVFIVRGNHDAGNPITGKLPLQDLGMVKVFSDRQAEVERLDGMEGLPRVAIHGQSFKKGPITDNLASRFPQGLPGYFNIGLLHTSLDGKIGHDPYAPCQLGDLTTHGYDYWALGHIHKTQILSRTPWVVFPGNLQGRSIRETGPKGCFLVEVEDDRVVSAEHRALDVIRWEHAEVDAAFVRDDDVLRERLRQSMEDAWARAGGLPAALRVTIRGETPLHDELLGRPERLRANVEEAAVDIAHGEIWLEKVKVETVRPQVARAQAEEAAAGGVAVEGLVEILREIGADPLSVMPLVERALGPLRSKLPDELKDHPMLDALKDPEAARRLVERLEPLIAARLAEAGG